MVRINTICESLVKVCNQSQQLPDDITYASVELDREGEHSNVSLPAIEFLYSVDRITSRNTEKTGVETDDDGTPIGYIFTRWYDAEIEARIQSASQSRYTHRDIEEQFRDAFALYDSHTPISARKPLPDPNAPGEKLNGINYVSIGGHEHDNNFAVSPSLRTESVSIVVKFTHALLTSELGVEYDVLKNVETPKKWVETTDDGAAVIK